MSFVMTSPPAAEPVTVAALKSHLRIDTADEDILLASLLLTSRMHIETALSLALINQSWTLRIDCWPRGYSLELPLTPLRAVDEVRVKDANGEANVVAPESYLVDLAARPPRLVWNNVVPPAPQVPEGGIEIDLSAGFGADGESVPAPLKHAILMLAAHWYEHRDPSDIGTNGARILDDGLAGSIAESWLYETWATRESAAFKLPPSALALEPGDIVSAEIAGRTRLLRLTDVSEHGVRDVQALSIDPSVYDQIDVPARTATPPPLVQIGSPSVALIDLPQWNASLDASLGYVAAMQKPWPGSVALFASPQETGYQLKAVATAAATLGMTLDELPSGPEGRIDHRASFRIRLTNGTLSSVDLVAMLAGANLAALRNENGDWEIIQFQSAELVDAQTYRLSGLLRGLFGTESAMANTLESGAPIVLLDGALASVPLQESERKLTLNWRYGPGNRDIGDDSYVTLPFLYQGLGLRPFSPAHVKGARMSGDIRLSWIRRTRTGGDNWELPEVPLGEESESYEVDILDGTSVKRTLTTSTPSVVYTASDQVADFGGVQSSVSVKVYQTNVLFGRGAPRVAMV